MTNAGDVGSAEASEGGRRIGPYRIVRELGRGGQGAVFLAEDVRIGRRVALKVLDASPARSPDALERFRREATIGARLDHPGICPVFDVGLEGRTPFLAMKLVAGETLAQKITTARDRGTPEPALGRSHVELPATDEDPPPPAATPGAVAPPPAARAEILRIVRLVESAARALHAAHEAGVVHRDVKPGNCMVGADGAAVLLDFGLAAESDDELPALTRTGDLMGTPAYMSPEQLAAQRIRLDRRTDVYSLGVTLYECLTLRRPFEAPTREGLYQAIMTKEPPDLGRLNSAIPRDLRVVAATAMEKDRDRRYATAHDFAEDLARVRRCEPIAARPASAWTKAARWIRRNPALAAATAVTFLSMAGGLAAAAVLLRQKDDALNDKSQALLRESGERRAKEIALAEKAAALDDYDRLGDVGRLRRVEAAARELWPAVPAKAPAMAAWLRDAQELASRLPSLRASVDALRPAIGPTATDALRFKFDTMSRLVTDLETFVDADPRRGALASVRARVAAAAEIEAATLGPATADAWTAACARVAAPNGPYRGLALRPRVGLTPLGPDPRSGFEEFLHWPTTDPAVRARGPARRRDDGRFEREEGHGLIFVLLPGGSFTMGARKPTEEERDDEIDGEPLPPHVDPYAEDLQGPPHRISLGPFYLAKHELTQAQWLRFSESNPTAYAAGKAPGTAAVTLSHPVTNVSWNELVSPGGWLQRADCELPTEAQWEYACRAATTDPWWTGRTRDSLRNAANVHDAAARKNGSPPGWGTPEGWEDGYVVHAPIGSFAPNAFGLHDTLGNVWEWCRDSAVEYADFAPRAGDGLRSADPDARMRIIRGGAYDMSAVQARCAYRGADAPDTHSPVLGVRPALNLAR